MKKRLRVKAVEQRESYSRELALWNDEIARNVLRFHPYILSLCVALYSSIGKEVATDPIRDHAWQTGKKVFYPRWREDNHLELVQACSAAELRPGKFNVLEPVGETVLTGKDQEQAVVFVPGLAFDLRGNRLGRGLGCYDRLLASVSQKAVTVGLAYEFQLVSEVPVDAWDRKVQNIITERRVVQCNNTTLSRDWAL